MRNYAAILLLFSLITLSACRSKPAGQLPQPIAPQVAATAAATSVPLVTVTPVVVNGTPAPAPAETIAAPAPTRQPLSTPAVPPMPIPTPVKPLIEFYTVQPGDTLGGISYAYDIPLEDLVALNGLDVESAIIQVGQTLHVPLRVERTGPLVSMLPDSEVVYSPAYVGFDVADFAASQGGFLAGYTETVNGVSLSGAEIISRLARQYSVGPRVLLALLEYYGGWVTQTQPTSARPLGPANPYGDRLYLQMAWAAARVNEGYYGYKQNGSIAVRFKDRTRAIIPYGLNAGTVGVMNVLAVNSDWDTWLTEVDAAGFVQTYRRLFGDPFARAVEPLVPADLTQPPLSLPWETGRTFYFTGGPHAAYGDGSSWAALDFGPPDVLGSCFYSAKNLTAVADGQLFLGSKGETYLDLDADGNLQTGWVLLYLHMVARDNLVQGQMVTTGAPLGYASCEGGLADATHLHFARRFNGEWIAADGPVPFNLSGWQAQAGLGQYEGDLVRGSETKSACECWDDEMNGLVAE